MARPRGTSGFAPKKEILLLSKRNVKSKRVSKGTNSPSDFAIISWTIGKIHKTW
ncbi:hypothetical protein LEP1GSC203_0879 [Leptospira terpstrae serovar Hualin str. LT 11-33 = ATCC 700639]|uniref:Uncharacterized protein n=1 Tax=Leptospira terpstrae serovar Hualin str. LT 11-33 = ATCC 700639 TaxID=1257025 RepID=N1VKF7_9LEPT|nr:hypothetical protein LEP1GSC203_0879 [Leptospira terpstrae serovar Hualin str. LT 11-33 = ATCC 700639]